MCGEDGVRTQRRRPEPLEDAALAVDRDDRDERQHRAQRDHHRCEHGDIDADQRGGARRGCDEPPSKQTAEHDEDQHRDGDGPDRAERLAHEDLDLQPGQFQEATQHPTSIANRVTGELEEDVLEIWQLGAEICHPDPVLG